MTHGRRKRWGDHLAGLVITIVGAVVAAIIVTLLIPAIQNDVPRQLDQVIPLPGTPAGRGRAHGLERRTRPTQFRL